MSTAAVNADDVGPTERVAAQLPMVVVAGRPNVGKSSLLNSLLGFQRSIVSAVPGTTRDAIDTELEFQGQRIRLIDTAGIRRRGRVSPGVEKYSVLRSTRAIDRCDIALLLIDASEGVAAQDTHIAGEISEHSKGVVVVVNKWDLAQEQRRAEREGEFPHPKDEIESAESYRKLLAEDLKFIPYAPVIFASAKSGYHVRSILEAALKIAEMRYLRVPTSKLNEVVQDAIRKENADRPAGEQMRFRIGIHVGDIIVQGDNLFGDGLPAHINVEAQRGCAGCHSQAQPDSYSHEAAQDFLRHAGAGQPAHLHLLRQRSPGGPLLLRALSRKQAARSIQF